MASKLENWLHCIKHCWSVYEQNIVNSFRVDDRRAELEIIASDDL